MRASLLAVAVGSVAGVILPGSIPKDYANGDQVRYLPAAPRSPAAKPLGRFPNRVCGALLTHPPLLARPPSPRADPTVGE